MNLDLLRSFAAIAKDGSISRTAERMRVSQSTLTRQMQALETEIGGPLLERSRSGVALTAAGQTMFQQITPLILRFDAVIAETRDRARGQTGSLRIGYMMSAAAEYLNPALARVRAELPHLKVKLVDMSPGEQVEALRRGELDLALVGNADASLAREFIVKRIAALPVVVAVPERHPLASRTKLRLADLDTEVFVGAKDADLPGYDRWIIQLCRRARFRPRFVEDADSLTHALSLLVAENAVTLLPALSTQFQAPGVAFRPLDDATAKWELLVAWQRGKISAAVSMLVDALSKNAKAKAGR